MTANKTTMRAVLAPDYNDRLAAAMDADGVTIEALADRTGVPQYRIAEMLTGVFRPNTVTRAKIERAVDATLCDPWDGDE